MNLISRSSWPGEVLTFFSFCIYVLRPDLSWRRGDHPCHMTSLDWDSKQLIKAIFFIHVHKLLFPKCGVQEISTGHEEDKVFITEG